MTVSPVTVKVSRIVSGASRSVVIDDAEEKLRFRAMLPGAFGWDQAAHVLRALQADGAQADDLLPLALPTSWMVNAKASSRAFQRWLLPPASDAWSSLLAALPGSMPLADVRRIDPDLRDEITAHVATLIAVEGAGLSSLTKVLALLRPQIVPLMDDAAIWWALDAVPEPTSAEPSTASADLFFPMLDWFAKSVADNEDALVGLAARHDLAVLDAPQVLDRLLWIESWGHRHMPARAQSSPRS